jgi:D-erythro-7,8-dihydroneopterin triphosphate epimerase
MIATIRIKNLRLRTFIGIKEEERNNRQDVVVNVVITTNIHDAVVKNELETSLNYRDISKSLIHLLDGQRFELMEQMTFAALSKIMEHPKVLSCQIEIDKVGALRYCDSVSMTLTGDREDGKTDWKVKTP